MELHLGDTAPTFGADTDGHTELCLWMGKPPGLYLRYVEMKQVKSV